MRRYQEARMFALLVDICRSLRVPGNKATNPGSRKYHLYSVRAFYKTILSVRQSHHPQKRTGPDVSQPARSPSVHRVSASHPKYGNRHAARSYYLLL